MPLTPLFAHSSRPTHGLHEICMKLEDLKWLKPQYLCFLVKTQKHINFAKSILEVCISTMYTIVSFVTFQVTLWLSVLLHIRPRIFFLFILFQSKLTTAYLWYVTSIATCEREVSVLTTWFQTAPFHALVVRSQPDVAVGYHGVSLDVPHWQARSCTYNELQSKQILSLPLNQVFHKIHSASEIANSS